MTQLILNIEEPSVLPVLKKLVGLIEGVSIAKPVRRKTHTKTNDSTEMTKDEFYAMIDEAKEQARNGQVGPVFNSSKEMFEYIESL